MAETRVDGRYASGPNGRQENNPSPEEEDPNENADPAEEPDLPNTPLRPTIAETRVEVRYLNFKKVLTFDITTCTFEELKTRIETMFGMDDQEKYYHILAEVPVGGDNGVTTYDIDKDGDIRELRNVSLLMVYPGGPYCIRLGPVQTYSLNQIPAHDTCLAHEAKKSVLPGYDTKEFVDRLRKLLQSLRLATACFILTNNIELSNTLNDFGDKTLLPVFYDCLDTFGHIVDHNNSLLDGLMATLANQRDDLPLAADKHLKDIGKLAVTMQEESKLRETALDTARNALIKDYLKVVEKMAMDRSLRQEIMQYLNDAIQGLRELRNIMLDLLRFWFNVGNITSKIEKNPFMTDLIELCRLSSIPGRDGANSREAQWIGRTKQFKEYGMVYIARHVAIRQICIECQVPFKEFICCLQVFLGEYWNEETAKEKHSLFKLGQDQPNIMYPAIPKVKYDEETTSAVRALLNVSNWSDVNQVWQETGDADIPISEEVDRVQPMDTT